MGTGDNGQHIADDLTQVAADIATVDGVHTNTELVTDLLDRADVHHAAVALRWLAVTEPKLCVDPTDITVAPLVDDADIVATLEGPSVATLDAAAIRWSKELVDLRRSPTTSNLLLGLTHNNYLVHLLTRIP
ncbi:hypothetical protein GCM10029964_089140 [Kibdelosporangium lantanae]